MTVLIRYTLKATLFFILFQSVYAAPNSTKECNGVRLETTFQSEASWSMCATLDNNEGLVINQLNYGVASLERRVLSKASLAQLETVFDDNTSPPAFRVTKEGLGGSKTITLTADDCPQGKIYPDTQGRKVICARTQKDNLLYKYSYQAQRQESFFEVFSISQITSFQTYTQRWRFYESGVIEPSVGFSGKLPRFAPANLGFGRAVADSNEWALGFSSYLGWRLDFDLGKNPNNDIAEEITSTPSASRRQKTLSTTNVVQETARSLNPELKTTWRIKDGDETNASGQAISYEIVPSQYHQSASNVRGRPWLKNDIYFTRYHECEKYPSDNNAIGGCPRNVLQYLQNKEPIEKADLVVWYKQNYHYLPRSDDSDYISTEWVGFQLMPRDWTANNPL
ncbi:MAG: hypothetical protein WAT29_08735 [Thiolinea sp.]